MKTEEFFDDYLTNSLDAEDKKHFEERLANDKDFGASFARHKEFVNVLKQKEDRAQLRKKLQKIHLDNYGEERAAVWNSYWRTVAVAASTAVIAVLSTIVILSKGGYLLTSQSNQIMYLNRKVSELRATNEGIVEGITRKNKKVYAPANFEGSAFAISNKGFILTSYHMIKGADSIYIRNAGLDRTSAHLVLAEPALDLAILKVDDPSVSETWEVPFSLKDRPSDVGERVFTLGYPRNEMVYGDGAISSLSGYSNDTSMYQISIPVNPGNSGGPLLDEHGSVVGVIRGKIGGAEATGFAVKAGEILRTISLQAPDSVKRDLASPVKKSPLRTLKRSEQIKRINPYVFNVLVYKAD
jgi:serine protease Do